MPPDAKKHLFDIQRAYTRLANFTAGRSGVDYESDEMLRSAVERQFEIIGEALTRLLKTHPDVAQRITEYRRIISFRNVLIHGYDAIRDAVVWEVLEHKLPVLRTEVEAMLNEPEQP